MRENGKGEIWWERMAERVMKVDEREWDERD